MAPASSVTNEQVAEYHETVAFFAKRYDGYMNAEYDDLYQEGMLAVIEALMKGQRPLKDIIARRMTRWVSKCARQGISSEAPSYVFD